MFFRLGLGDDEKAIDDAKLYERNYAQEVSARDLAGHLLAGLDLRASERLAEGRRALPELPEEVRSSGTSERGNPRQRRRSASRCGSQNKKPDAEKFFKAATKLWNSGAPAAIEKLADGDAEKAAKWAAEGSQATAQALWYLAEYQFADVRQDQVPRAQGRGRT